MAADTSKAEHAADAGSGGLPQFDFSTWSSQIFWLVVCFGLLYLVLSLFILPRVREGLTERSDRIADDLDAASRMQKEAEQAAVAYERVVANAKAKAHNIAETTRKSVDAEIEAEIAEAEAEFATKQAVADERIAKIRSEAMSHIDSVAQETASAIVNKLGQIKPTAAKVKTAISGAKG